MIVITYGLSLDRRVVDCVNRRREFGDSRRQIQIVGEAHLPTPINPKEHNVLFVTAM